MDVISIITPFAGSTLDLLPDFERATIGAELIIIDNASDAPTAEALAALPTERGMVLRNETNIGFAAANNQGYAKASGDVIIFLNSDIAADPAWLKHVADDVQDGALYGPALGVQLVYGLRVPYIEGWCVAATRKTWDRLVLRGHHEIPYMHEEAIITDGIRVRHEPFGPWDALSYPGPYWEDNDLCLRALQQDIALTQTTWPVQHKGGRTAGALVRHGATFEANRATFTSRVKAAWEGMQHG